MTRLMTKKGNAGTRRSAKRYKAPSFSTPRLIAASFSPNFFWIASRKRKRLARKASVAPIDAANEMMTVPHSNPKIAPPASVMSAAPGSESPVTAT